MAADAYLNNFVFKLRDAASVRSSRLSGVAIIRTDVRLGCHILAVALCVAIQDLPSPPHDWLYSS